MSLLARIGVPDKLKSDDVDKALISMAASFEGVRLNEIKGEIDPEHLQEFEFQFENYDDCRNFKQAAVKYIKELVQSNSDGLQQKLSLADKAETPDNKA